jgi:hypothetical protein
MRTTAVAGWAVVLVGESRNRNQGTAFPAAIACRHVETRLFHWDGGVMPAGSTRKSHFPPIGILRRDPRAALNRDTDVRLIVTL